MAGCQVGGVRKLNTMQNYLSIELWLQDEELDKHREKLSLQLSVSYGYILRKLPVSAKELHPSKSAKAGSHKSATGGVHNTAATVFRNNLIFS